MTVLKLSESICNKCSKAATCKLIVLEEDTMVVRQCAAYSESNIEFPDEAIECDATESDIY